MSTIRAEVIALENLRPHGNADSLELATAKGWQMAVRKGVHHDGQKVVYFEAGTVLPPELCESLGITNFMNNKTDINGDKVLVVGKIKLRGEPSFGLVVLPENETWELGEDVATHYGATKFRPPVKSTAGDAEEDHPAFEKYTDIENLRNFMDIFEDGEEVEITEKPHGTNCRVGFVQELLPAEELHPTASPFKVTKMAGSRELRRKEPPTQDQLEANTYWFPHTLPGVSQVLNHLTITGKKAAAFFGEVFGASVQKGFDYGLKRPGFRVFDLQVEGRYLDRDQLQAVCDNNVIERAPVLYRGPYSFAKVVELANGKSEVGGQHIREGVVVVPVKERQHPRIGRVVLKYVSDAYLFRKGGEDDDTTDQ